MQLIRASKEHEVLAVGSRAELIKLLHAEQQKGRWQFPVYVAPDDVRWTNDEERYTKAIEDAEKATEERQVKLIRQCLLDGILGVASIADATGMTYTQVNNLKNKYNLLSIKWRASRRQEVVEAKSATELAKKLGSTPFRITNANAKSTPVSGYLIRKVVKVR